MKPTPHDPRLVIAVIMVTVAMGALDAVSLAHLKVFTGYMTATLILIAVHLASAESILGPGLLAIGSYLIGAAVGGRLVRRAHSRRRTVADLLMAVGTLVLAASAVWWAGMPWRHFMTLVILAIAMGLQTSATRHAQVTDLTLPAATMLLHGLVHDSRLAGGPSRGAWRRLAAILGLFGGAVLGTFVSSVSVAGAIAMVGVTIGCAGFLLYLEDHPLLDRLENAGPGNV
ncbi:DUF1275 domain-containing protein [Gluconacetobacter diazotrophicus]|uniref:DUF1275 domain-containing protein n=1 Tax=Gluconacetobacter diazotrophicus TaxID=33996 RepID=A0A7W4FCL6_GLUDI|nr:YoaK family protein [Gluconacetobacter diazotrophicus]MBB2155203.1 DUF1275 domain-containing protein [Gluconacetobacter diazotrophicus]